MKSKCFHFVLLCILLIAVLSIQALAADYTPVSGVGVTISSQNSKSYSNGAVTVTAKGSGGVFGIGASSKTTTIAIAYSGEKKATVSFDWTATSVNQLTIDGTPVTATTGTVKKVMSSGESFAIKIVTGTNDTENKLVMSNFAVTEVADKTKVTFVYNASLGSVSVAGNNIVNGGSADISSNGATLVATASSGVTFLGWVDSESHKILDTNGSYTFTPPSECTVVAAFASAETTAWFLVDGLYLCDDLNTAAKTGSTIVLAANGVLPIGNYTIPSGVKLLIPYSDSDTGNFGDPGNTTTLSGSHNAYRTLTVPSGTTIEVNGSVCVNAVQYASSVSNTGCVAGDYGYIKLDGNLNLNSGAKLYCYGYISGDGTVTASSGSTVHELFQMMDWRGASVMSSAKDKLTGESFLVSQYYLQNIESNLKMCYGATEIMHAMIAAGLGSSKTPYPSSATYVGSNGFIVMESESYFVRSYTSDGRIVYELHGNAEIGEISITISTTSLNITSQTVKSSDYVLNVPSNMSIVVASGTATCSNSIKLLPDTAFQVNDGAELKLTGSSSLILYDYKDWTRRHYARQFYFAAVNYSPTGKKSGLSGDDAKLIVNGTLTVESGSAIYSTNDVDQSNLCLSGTGKIVWASFPTSWRTTIKECLSTGEGLVTEDSADSYPTVPLVPLQAYYAKSDKALSSVNAYSAGSYYGIVIDGTNYWYKASATVDPTCIDAGYIKYYCDDAASYVSVPNGMAALGHDFTEVTATVAKTVYTCSGCDDTYENDNVAAIITGSSGDRGYDTLAKAVAAYNGTGYIKLLADVTGDVSVTGKLVLDLAGHTLDGSVTATSFSGLDSATDNYSDAKAGKITGKADSVNKTYQTAETSPFQRYVAIQNADGETSFHRFNISVTSFRALFNPSDGGRGALHFEALFRGDSAVMGEVKEIGFTLTCAGSKATDTPTTTKPIQKSELFISDAVWDKPLTAASVAEDCAATAYIKFDGSAKGTVTSLPQSITYLQALKTAYANPMMLSMTNTESTLRPTEVIDDFMATYGEALGWDSATALTAYEYVA